MDNKQSQDQLVINAETDGNGENGSARQSQQPENTGQPANNKMRRNIVLGILGVLIIIGAIYGWDWYQFIMTHETTDNAQIEGNISPVIPRVDGYVDKIYVDDNQEVAKGDLLVTIDKAGYELGVKQAQAGLEGAKAAKEDASARLSAARAQVNSAQVALKQARTEQARQQKLLQEGSTTQQRYDNAKFGYESAQTSLEVAKRQVKVAQVAVQQAQANIEKAQTAVENAQLHLSYTELRAPIAGKVSKKNIETGEYIRPGQPVMAIASDKDVWVVANFKEGQIAYIKVGQPVDVEVDAYPDSTFKGKVQSIGGATGSKFALLPPDNASGNFVKVEQRIPVKIVFTGPQNSDTPLRPGMNVEPSVDITKR